MEMIIPRIIRFVCDKFDGDVKNNDFSQVKKHSKYVTRTCREGEDATDEDAPRRRQGRRHSSCLGLLDRRRRLGFL